MSAELNKAIVKRPFDELNKGNVDAARAMYASDYSHHWHGGLKSLDDFDKEQKTNHNRRHNGRKRSGGCLG